MMTLTLKKRHLMIIPLVFLTFLLFSTRREEPRLFDGFIIITPLNDCQTPAAQITFQSNADNFAEPLHVESSHLFTNCTLLTSFDSTSGLDTGISILNPTSSTAQVKMSLYHDQGFPLKGNPIITIPPFEKRAFLLSNLLPRTIGLSFHGHIRIFSSTPIGILGLQTAPGKIRNIPIEPIQEDAKPLHSRSTLFPHFATGGGYRCTLHVWNPTESSLTCEIHVHDAHGRPVKPVAKGWDSPVRQVCLSPGQSVSIPLEMSAR